MCTGIFVKKEGQGLLFGRNMDVEAHFGERLLITPRQMPLSFRCLPAADTHYAMLGMGVPREGFPLYGDAMNEKGLCMAGLHFPGNAVYLPAAAPKRRKYRLAPFELIPYVLAHCATVAEVRNILTQTEIADIPFSHDLPNTPLHWQVAARDGGLIIEAVSSGLQVYEDLYGVLTNNPPYPFHTAHISLYDGLMSAVPHTPHRPSAVPLGNTYDLGTGMVGLPGDYTSPARFVRAAVLLRYGKAPSIGEGGVAALFRILGAVAPPIGCIVTSEGKCHATRYTACMDMRDLTYHVLAEKKITPLSVRLTHERCEGKVMR